MRHTAQIDEQNPIELSFLDVMSCGMIAAMFLALVFSVIGEIPPQELKAMPFLEMIVDVENTDSSLGLAFKTEMDDRWIVLPIEEFDLMNTGMLKKTATVWQRKLAPYGDFQLLGFKPFFRSKRQFTTTGDRIRLIVHIENPANGKWQFNLFRRDPNLATESQPITIRAMSFLTDSNPKQEFALEEGAEPIQLVGGLPNIPEHTVTGGQR